MSSGMGRGRGLGSVRANSWGSVVLVAAFLSRFPWEILTASWSMRISISGRHLKDTHANIWVVWIWNALLTKQPPLEYLCTFLTRLWGNRLNDQWHEHPLVPYSLACSHWAYVTGMKESTDAVTNFMWLQRQINHWIQRIKNFVCYWLLSCLFVVSELHNV